MTKTINKTKISKVALLVILFCIIVLPIIRMLFYLDFATIKQAFTSKTFGKATLNSLTSTLVATIISLILAYALAWALNRSQMKFKQVFSMILILPMLIPSISHGIGLGILFGNSGVFTEPLGLGGIYGFGGVVLGSVLYSFPVAFLMFADILKYQDASPYEAAQVLGISKFNQFKAITLPYLKKPLISVAFATFTMIVTDYGVPIAIGGQFKTLPVMLYEETVGLLNYSLGALIGLVLLIPAVIAFLFDFFNKDTAKSSFTTRPIEIKKSKSRDAIAYAICSLVSLFVILVIFSFCLQAFTKMYPSDKSFTFANFKTTFDKNAGYYLFVSIVMAGCTAIIGTVIAFLTAYLTARVRTGATKALHLIAITSLAIPGLVLGLSYVLVFNKSFIYGTIIMLILVNTVHFFASPYLMIYNAFNKINGNLEDVGNILGISKLRVIKDVIIPQTKSTIIEMLSYFFVNCMMTISAVSFLASPQSKPLSLLINQFETYNMLECSAVVAILILLVNCLIKGITYLVTRKK